MEVTSVSASLRYFPGFAALVVVCKTIFLMKIVKM